MEASSDLIVKQSFVLKPEHIRNVFESLNTKIGSIEISTHCEDGINRNFSSTDQLLSYSNPPKSKIQSISLRARSDDHKKSARIVFSNDNWRPIQFEVQGPEDIVIILKDDFINKVVMTKAWYDRFARLDIFWLIYGIGIATFVILLLCIAIGILTSEKPTTDKSIPKEQAMDWLIGMSGVGFLGFVGLLISRLKGKLFPIGTFAWGGAAEKHELLEKVRWTIVIGFIVSFLSGIVATIIVSIA